MKVSIKLPTKEKAVEGLKATMLVVGCIFAAISSAYYETTCVSDEDRKRRRIRELVDKNPNASYGYGRAVEAIVNSNGSDYYKGEMLDHLKKDASYDYYVSVEHIAKSDMSDYYKTEAISSLK